ncbi:hypothetical protein V2J09_006016 [Rumex salicifolius]
MVDDKVTLHATWYSPYSNRIEMALKLKGVEYERIEEDLFNKSPELVHYNPVHKKIPVLVHGSHAISESQVILEYIDETWSSSVPILPFDPYKRARARFWARFIDDKLFLPLYRGIIKGEEHELKEAMEKMKFLDKELEGKRFFGGEQMNLVDIVANTIGYWVPIFEEAAGKVSVTSEAYPSLCKWRHEFLNCDVIQQAAPTTNEKLVALFRDRFNAHNNPQTSNS